MSISTRFFFTLTAAACFLFAIPTFAQPRVADKILAIVGKNRIILQSELELQVQQTRQQDSTFKDEQKCGMLQQMIMAKMLVEQAERDSLLVSDDEVTASLDNRIRYFTRLYGSQEKLEQASGKTVYQLKDDYRDITKENMMADKMREKILANLKITPTEVRDFFGKIPADSLPFFPATVEMGQIVVDPPTNPELDLYAREKLEGIRKQIVDDNKSFELMAGLYSQDPGTRDNGGRMDGITRNGDLVQEFVTAAFRLKNGEVSPVFKTQFGYHIIQMIQRKGEQADVRHILIMPEHTSGDYTAALLKLDSVRSELVSGKITFPLAVGKYSTDAASKMTGGMISNASTGSTLLEVDQLDPAMALMVDSLATGSYSQPQLFSTPQGERSARIVYMKTRTAPHKANLTDDYSQIQRVALEQKKNHKLENWVTTQLNTFYIKIDPEYQDCPEMKGWAGKTAQN